MELIKLGIKTTNSIDVAVKITPKVSDQDDNDNQHGIT